MTASTRLSGLMDDYDDYLHEQTNLDCLSKEDFDAPRGNSLDSFFCIFDICMLSTVQMQLIYKSRKDNLVYSILS